MAISFDGPNKIVTLSTGVTSVEVAEIYSRWKEWVATSDNGKYLPAFEVIGGDPISADASLAVTTFIRNDLGWRLRPPAQNIDVSLIGNLYAKNPALPWRTAPTGSYQTSINTDNSVNAVVVTVSGGGSGGETEGQLWP